MMKKTFRYLTLIIAIFMATSLACRAVTELIDDDPGYSDEENGNGYETDESEAAQSDPDVEESLAGETCPAITENILTTAIQPLYEDDYGEEKENQYLVSYQITGNEISNPYYENVSGELKNYQDDTTTHKKIWDYYTTLIPANRRTVLVEFIISTDGEDNGLAAVAQTPYDPNLWSLEVDIADADDKLNLTYTLIHEFAHLLTLGPDQVTPSIPIFNNPEDDDIYYDEVADCPVYFPGEGCSQADSFINAFFNTFWADIHEEWQDVNLNEDDDAYYEALDDFYYKYEDRFVTDYAVTNPEEDIAETFTFFVLSPRPAGNTVAEEKILFFYDYPELVQLRDEIVNGICSLNP